MFRYEVQFACLLLEDAFGPVVSTCARLLLLHGSLTILELRDLFLAVPSASGVSPPLSRCSRNAAAFASGCGRPSTHAGQDVYPLVRNALLVLLQHNLLLVTPIDGQGAPSLRAAPQAAGFPGDTGKGGRRASVSAVSVQKPPPGKPTRETGKATKPGDPKSETGSESPCLFAPDEGLEVREAETPDLASAETDLHGPTLRPGDLRNGDKGARPADGPGAAAPQPHGTIRYSLDLDEVLVRLRYTRFAVHVQQTWGFACRVILLQVMRAGRQCIREAVQSALEDPYTHFDISAVSGGSGLSGDAEDDAAGARKGPGGVSAPADRQGAKPLTDLVLRRAFLQLISSSILIQAEPPLHLSPGVLDDQGQGDLRGGGAVAKSHGRKRGRAAAGGAAGKQQKTRDNRGADGFGNASEGEDGMGNEQASALGVPAYLLNLLGAQGQASTGRPSHNFASLDELGDSSLSASAALRDTPGSKGSSALLEQQATYTKQQRQVEKQLLERLEEQRVPFRVNTQLLTLALCKQVAESFILARVGDNRLARATVRALLDAGVELLHGEQGPGRRHQTQTLQAEQEATQQGKARLNFLCKWIKFDAVEQAVKANLEKLGVKKEAMQKAQLIRLLEALAKHPDRFLQATLHDGQSMYKLNWEELRAVLRRRLLYDAVVARCGEKAGRVWSLMACKHSFMVERSSPFWDDQTVADMALLPPQGARKIFYLLAKEGFARFHESDRLSASATQLSNKHALVVTISSDAAVLQVLQNFYHMALNLLERKCAEAARLLQLQTKGQSLSPEEVLQLRKREAAEDLLEAHLLAMSEPLMILRDL
ncbi:DNA-directed RNA polymerase III POLR3C [Toxoplasma gondii ARI]|uniref:DNA-directed RNA polymerase III subunit RPC3 n=1 Tax=Toxoplasma gondii ARI TaxID=1074872 RepID=A0A139XTK9_TOXGO|nr:DNA-directed RNA polymerase III POLR3C [Toxoplasma gondii ARI]